MVTLHQSDSIAAVLVEAICTGNLESLQRLLHENPGLAAARIQDHKGVSRTPLHIATDWPGYFPNGVAVVTTLVSAGADPNAPMLGCRHSETPLHWAASSDDVDVAAALIAVGADVEARGASIGAVRRWMTRLGTAAGRSPVSWSSAAPESTSYGTRPRWA
jgi:ankyrin repeat protein